MSPTYCNLCFKKININEHYYEDDYGDVLCNNCGDDQLMSVSDQLGEDTYVRSEQYRDVYLDDDISDLNLYHRKEHTHE